MAYYSHSRLSTYEQCKLQFKYQYIDKIKTDIEETVETFMGSRVHETLEKLYVDLRFQILTPLPELLEYYNKQWKKNWNENIVIVREERTEDNYRKMGEKFITDFYEHYKPFDQTRTVGLETSRTVKLDEAGRYRIHIKIDRLALSKDGAYEIHDYKTSNSLPTQEDVDKDRQLAIYAYGVKKMYPDAEKIKLIWHYLAFDKEMVSVRSTDELETLRNKILDLIADIEKTTDFPPHKSPLCNWCRFQPICPEWKHMFKTRELEANVYLKEDGVVLVNKYAELSEKQKTADDELEKVKEALTAYAKKNNMASIVGSDVIASIRTYPKLSFPKKDDPRQREFWKKLKEVGLWDQLTQADVYELTKRINRGEVPADIVKILEPYIERGENTRIYLRKM